MNKQLIRETISELRNEARELYDKGCLTNSGKLRYSYVEESSKLSRIANELEKLLVP